VIGSLSSEFILLKIVGSQLLHSLLSLDHGIAPTDLVTHHLLDFLPICPTFHAAQALKTLSNISPSLVLPRATFIIDNILEFLQPLLNQLQSPDADDDQEDVVMTNLTLLASLVRASQFIPDSLISLIAVILSTDFSQWEGVYDSLGFLLREIFLSGSSRARDILTVLIAAFSEYEHIIDFLNVLLEPIEALIGADPGGFLSLGISLKLLELCGILIESDASIESFGTICRIAANIGFVDDSVAPQFGAISQKLFDANVEFVYALELLIAPIVGRKSSPDVDLVVQVSEVLRNGGVKDSGQFHLFVSFLALAVKADDSFAALVFELLERELQLRAEHPPAFISVYDTFDPATVLTE
jgi:hypothetical protein